MHEIIGFKWHDHIDRNKLNNLESNFRLASPQQQCFNVGKYIGDYSSKYKGVHFDKEKNKWRARIRFNRELIHLGYFDSEVDAALAYDRKAKELFKEFAVLNYKVT